MFILFGYFKIYRALITHNYRQKIISIYKIKTRIKLLEKSNEESDNISSRSKPKKDVIHSKDFDKLLQQEISQFKIQESKLPPLSSGPSGKLKKVEEVNNVEKNIKNIFSLVLIADFFIVIFFLIWFLIAAALQSTNPFFLERFQDIFNPIVVPSLTVLMVGSIASGIFDNSNKNKS
jgi:hypothetical protein